MLKHVFYSIGLPLFSTRWVQSRVFIKLPLVTPKALCGVDQSQKYSANFLGEIISLEKSLVALRIKPGAGRSVGQSLSWLCGPRANMYSLDHL